MLSKVISVSEKVNMLPDLFDMLLFTWMIPHTDDYGRLGGSPAKVKALVVPMLDKSIKDVEAALRRLNDAKLIIWYESNGEPVIQITNFEKHQDGLKRRSPSKFVEPRHFTSNDGILSASESEIEELVINHLETNSIIENEEIVSTERQLRINNSYVDILATGTSARRYLFEIKRQRLSNASIEQIIKYREMINDSNVSAILLGNGLSSNFDLERCRRERINVLVYDNNLKLEQLLLIDVKCRYLTLTSEGKGTEGNRTEQNGTEEEGNGMPDPDSNPHKNRIHKLINECEIREYNLHHLDVIFSYIGVVDIEVIESAIKKGQRKHVNYAVNALQGMVRDGIKKKEQVLPKPEVGEAPPGKTTSKTGRWHKPKLAVVKDDPKAPVSADKLEEIRRLAKEIDQDDVVNH